jgi:crossover junction endodeoxyribonuclease RuvC
MVILGIDPGLARVGYGAVEKNKRGIKCLDYGCIKTSPDNSPQNRLNQIFNEINKLIKKYKPNILVVEKLFFFKNAKTAIPVSQAKGVILLAGAKKKIPIYEFTPLQVKMAITGYGRAQKRQVQEMVKILLNLEKIPRPDDAADALGLAISYTYLPKAQKRAKNT